MTYIFGPVPSRRFGLSLGVDLIPLKTCTYDCLYCEVGRTTHKTSLIQSYAPVAEVLRELAEKLKQVHPDVITLAGSGEPTLYADIDQVIAFIKDTTNIPVVLLTNGSLLWQEQVRNKVLRADLIMPTLSSAFEETFRKIHKPDPSLTLSRIIEGYVALRKVYKGQLNLELFILKGINDTEEEIAALKEVIERINPDKVQLNTVVRPPAEPLALAVGQKRLEEIRAFLGAKAEIIAAVHPHQRPNQYDSLQDVLLETLRRRPMRAEDLANVLNLSLIETENLLKEMLLKKKILKREHAGQNYYSILS
jgi:wyosine [tRNA(Phe)-imidazoG37] synthetase (radical SAM superfamily)